MKLLRRSNNCEGVNMIGNKILNDVNYISFDENLLIVDFNKNVDEYNIKIIVKKRKNHNDFRYESAIEFVSIDNTTNTFFINISKLPISKDGENIWDVFAEVIDKEGFSIEQDLLILKDNYNFNYFSYFQDGYLLKSKPYITSKFNSLSILIKVDQVKANILRVSNNDKDLLLEGELQSEEMDIFTISEEPVNFEIISNQNDILNVEKSSVLLLNSYFTIRINLESLLKCIKSGEGEYSVILNLWISNFNERKVPISDESNTFSINYKDSTIIYHRGKVLLN